MSKNKLIESLNILMECQCKQKYSIEPHGKGHALYFGRCTHKHGSNILSITECSRKDILQMIEDKLNNKGK